MGWQDVTGDTGVGRFLGVFYGHPGTGKTRIGTAYPESWGKALYFAIDDDAYRLDSVLKRDRGRLTVFKMAGDGIIDNMNSIVVDDWKKDFPDHGVMIVDTLTTGSKRMLLEAANKHYFKGKDGDGHITFGPKDAEITQAIPSIADYGGGKFLMENWLTFLVQNQAPHFHIIVLCHEDFDNPRKEDPASVTAVGGPATFGRKLLSEFPAYFPTIIRMKMQSRTLLNGVNETKYTAISAMHGDYIARIKEGSESGNPMPLVELDATGRKWWDLYVKNFMGGQQ